MCVFVLNASYANALLWSNLVKQVKFLSETVGALDYKSKQFVFAGFATTKHLTVFLATVFIASPYALNIFPFVYKRSFLSIPGFLGNPPMNTATSASLKTTFGSDPV